MSEPGSTTPEVPRESGRDPRERDVERAEWRESIERYRPSSADTHTGFPVKSGSEGVVVETKRRFDEGRVDRGGDPLAAEVEIPEVKPTIHRKRGACVRRNRTPRFQ